MIKEEKESINETYSTILKKIARLRSEAGLAQIDLAYAIGLTDSGYFKVEKGKTKLDVERLLLILHKLGISPKEFFKDID